MQRVSGIPSALPHKITFTTLFCALILLLLPAAAISQEVIVHHNPAYQEDGDPKYDGDGSKNGIVVWKSGAVHVVDGVYSIYVLDDGIMNYYSNGPMMLDVKPGAIIKLAAGFRVDENGKLKEPAKPGGGIAVQQVNPNCYIKLDGVTITDIRDDSVGGDTNQDGSETSPEQGNASIRHIYTSRNNKDLINNCTFKYFDEIDLFGSAKITGNHFNSAVRFKSIILNIAPVISGNTFNYGNLELGGTSPLITNNTFNGTSFTIGPRFEDYGERPNEPAGPISGKTEFSYNVFVKTSIHYHPVGHLDTLYSKIPPFNLAICNNRFEESSLEVGLSDKAEIIGNEFNNTGISFEKDYNYKQFNGNTISGLRINNNRFDKAIISHYSIDSTNYRYWSRGLMVNAQYNYWGDPSGPEDKSNKDGLYNPHGKGIKVDNGFDYRNFIGASKEAIPDYIKIEAKAKPLVVLPPTEELVPDVEYSFEVKVSDYKLQSAPTGKIAVMIKDDLGMILNGNGTIISVSNSAGTLEVQPINVKIPAKTSRITAEASIAPDADGALTVYSNQVSFHVKQPQGAIKLIGIKDAESNGYPKLYMGAKYNLRAYVQYTLSGSEDGTLEATIMEKDDAGDNILQKFTLTPQTIKPGVNRTATINFEVNLPERDEALVPHDFLVILIEMKNSKGEVLGMDAGSQCIVKKKNMVKLLLCIPAIRKGDSFEEAGRNFLLTGEAPAIIANCSYYIFKAGADNWKIELKSMRVYSRGQGNPAVYEINEGSWNGLKTTNEQDETTSRKGFGLNDGSFIIPPGATEVTIEFDLIDQNGNKVTSDYGILPVWEASKRTEKDAARGSSQVSFDQIPIRLDFKSNTNPGKVSAAEFPGQFKNSGSHISNGKNTSAKITSVGLFQKFIPINRYWSVFDNLSEKSYSASMTITYDPVKDFPFSPDFMEDSLVIASVNRNNLQLEELPSKLDKASRTISTDYLKFYDTYVVASKRSSTTGLADRTKIPEEFTLLQNYPNPFNPSTTISYSISEPSRVVLKIYDVLGREVAELVNKDQVKGEYKVLFDASALPSGVYIYSINAEGFKESRKLMVIK